MTSRNQGFVFSLESFFLIVFFFFFFLILLKENKKENKKNKIKCPVSMFKFGMLKLEVIYTVIDNQHEIFQEMVKQLR